MIISDLIVDDKPVLALKGRIDSNTAALCEEALLSRVQDGRDRLLLDLREVDYISSTGLRILVMTQRRAAMLNADFVLCCLQPSVIEILEISGLVDLLQIQAGLSTS